MQYNNQTLALTHQLLLTLLLGGALLMTAAHSQGASASCTGARDCQPAFIYLNPAQPLARLQRAESNKRQVQAQQVKHLERSLISNLQSGKLLDLLPAVPDSNKPAAATETSSLTKASLKESSPLGLMLLGLIGLFLARRRVQQQQT